MREIKFRGVQIGTGKVVYGDYNTAWELTNPTIRVVTDDHADENGHIIATCDHYEVARESVAQFIARDKNGREIYEGDLCDWIKAPTVPFHATFYDLLDIDAGKIIKVANEYGQDE